MLGSKPKDSPSSVWGHQPQITAHSRHCNKNRKIAQFHLLDKISFSSLLIIFTINACVLSCFSYVWLFVILWLLCPWDSPGKNTGVLPRPCPGHLLDPGIEPMSAASPALQADSLPTEPPGKPLWINTMFKSGMARLETWACFKVYLTNFVIKIPDRWIREAWEQMKDKVIWMT